MPTRPEKPPSWNYGKRLRDLLKREGWSQERLAEELSVSSGTVSRWCTGSRDPGADMLKAICERVGLSVDEILGLNLSGAWPSHRIASFQQGYERIAAIVGEAERQGEKKG